LPWGIAAFPLSHSPPQNQLTSQKKNSYLYRRIAHFLVLAKIEAMKGGAEYEKSKCFVGGYSHYRVFDGDND
jgi:hypothetical protein